MIVAEKKPIEEIIEEIVEEKIKEIQSFLKHEGIQLTQAQIGESLVEFTIKNIQEFLLEMKKMHGNNTEDRENLFF